MNRWLGNIAPREKLSATKRRAVFLAKAGPDGITRCAECTRPLSLERSWEWEVDHDKDRWKGGKDEFANYGILCTTAHCHLEKTKAAARLRAKADRMGNKHAFGRKSRTPLPGGRNSPVKKTMKGKVQRR